MIQANNDLVTTMTNEIFKGVFFEAKGLNLNDGELDRTVDATLKSLLQIKKDLYYDTFIGSELKLEQIVTEMMTDVSGFDELFLEIYLKVVANGGEFEMITDKEKEYEVTGRVYGTTDIHVGGEETSVDWSVEIVRTVLAFSEDTAGEEFESIVYYETDGHDYSEVTNIEEL